MACYARLWRISLHEEIVAVARQAGHHHHYECPMCMCRLSNVNSSAQRPTQFTHPFTRCCRVIYDAAAQQRDSACMYVCMRVTRLKLMCTWMAAYCNLAVTTTAWCRNWELGAYNNKRKKRLEWSENLEMWSLLAVDGIGNCIAGQTNLCSTYVSLSGLVFLVSTTRFPFGVDLFFSTDT